MSWDLLTFVPTGISEQHLFEKGLVVQFLTAEQTATGPMQVLRSKQFQISEKDSFRWRIRAINSGLLSLGSHWAHTNLNDLNAERLVVWVFFFVEAELGSDGPIDLTGLYVTLGQSYPQLMNWWKNKINETFASFIKYSCRVAFDLI